MVGPSVDQDMQKMNMEHLISYSEKALKANRAISLIHEYETNFKRLLLAKNETI